MDPEAATCSHGDAGVYASLYVEVKLYYAMRQASQQLLG